MKGNIMSNEKKHLHFISHTHWDREWYMSHEKYLVRLVSLMDRLMDIMENSAFDEEEFDAEDI